MVKYFLIAFLSLASTTFASEASPDLTKKRERDTRLPARFREEEEIDRNSRVQKKVKAKRAKPVKGAGVQVKRHNQAEPLVERRESEWLRSLGVPGQNGLYAGEPIKAGQFIGWYEGKIYESQRKINELAPALKLIGTKKELGYFHKVENPKTGQYLYSIDGYQPPEGKDEICDVALVNHKPHGLANAAYKILPRKGAPGGFAMSVVATKYIKQGEEITSDYGRDYEMHLQENAPAYREFLKLSHPKYLIEVEVDDYKDWNYLRVSQLLELFPALFKEVTENTLNDKSAKALGGKYSKAVEVWSDIDVRLDCFRRTENAKDMEAGLQELDYIIATCEKLERNTFLSKSKQSSQLRYLIFKNKQRIAMAYWRKSLMLFGAELHTWETKLKHAFLLKRREAAAKARAVYAQSEDYEVEYGSAYEILGETLRKENRGAPELAKKPSAAVLTRAFRDDEKYRFDDADAYKDMGDAIIKEDSNPLKSDQDKIKDRKTAIGYYKYALYILEGAQQSTDIAGLRGHIYWNLFECHNDDILDDSEKARDFAEKALEQYQFAVKDRKAGADFDGDVEMAEAYLDESSE